MASKQTPRASGAKGTEVNFEFTRGIPAYVIPQSMPEPQIGDGMAIQLSQSHAESAKLQMPSHSA